MSDNPEALPQLPHPAGFVDADGEAHVYRHGDIYTADQMRAYARAALAQQAATPTDSYVQPVPDKCDRIVWRGAYYSLPLAAAQQAATPTLPLTNEQIDRWAAEQAREMPRPGWFTLSIPMLRAIIGQAWKAATPTDPLDDDVLTVAYMAGRYDGRKAAARQAATPAPAEPVEAAKRLWETIKVLGLTNDKLALQAIQRAMLAAAPATPAAQPAEERNQCDGCQASMPMRGGIHTDEAGHAVMLCQRGRYALKGNA